MSELNANEKTVLSYIAKNGPVKLDQIRVSFLMISDAEWPALIRGLYRKALITELFDGTVTTDYTEEEPRIWFDPNSLPWKEIMPKSAASRKKGPYENTPENMKSPVYKDIVQKIMEKGPDGQPKYRAVINGYTYWIDQYNGGLARRKLKEEKKDASRPLL